MPFASNYSLVLLYKKQFPTIFHMHAPSLLQYYAADILVHRCIKEFCFCQYYSQIKWMAHRVEFFSVRWKT